MHPIGTLPDECVNADVSLGPLGAFYSMKVVSVASWGDGQLRLKYFRKLLHALQGELRLEASRGLTRLSKAKLCFSLLMVSLVGCNVPDTRFEGLTLSPDGTYILAVYSHSAHLVVYL